jgi:hypothetical protein
LSTRASDTQSNSPSSTLLLDPITSSAAAQPTSPENDNDGLSTGAKAGIAIGVVAGSILLIALAFIVWRSKRRVGRHLDVHGDEVVQGAEASLQYGYKDTAELESQAIAELESRTAPHELHGSSIVVSEQPREA